MDALDQLPQPTIAKVRGHCFTGGLELALGCDLLVAAASATLGDTHGQWGLVPVWGMSVRLPERVGMSTAKQLMFTSRRIDGTEAGRLGLVDKVAADDELDAVVDSARRRGGGELGGYEPDRQAAAARRHGRAAQRGAAVRAHPAVRAAGRHGRADGALEALTHHRRRDVPAVTTPGNMDA